VLSVVARNFIFPNSRHRPVETILGGDFAVVPCFSIFPGFYFLSYRRLNALYGGGYAESLLGSGYEGDFSHTPFTTV
jgi:hypothetical protein